MKTKNIKKVKEGDLLLTSWGKVYKVSEVCRHRIDGTIFFRGTHINEDVLTSEEIYPYEVIAKINKIDFEF